MKNEIHLGRFYFSNKELKPIPKKRKLITRSDFKTEEEYLTYVGNAMKSYLNYLHQKGKL